MTDIHKQEEPILKRIRNRSIRQIASDIQNKKDVIEEPKNDKLDEVKKDAEEITEQKKEEKRKEREDRDNARIDETVKKTAEETAKKVSEETKLAFNEKIKEILNKETPIIDKQKETDELITAWDKENRLPNDYKELIDENLRVTQAKWNQLDKEKEERILNESKLREENEKKVKEEETKREEDFNKKLGEEKFKSFQEAINADLNDLHEAGLIARPTNAEEINNENTTDENAKAVQKLLKFGVELNTKLAKEGKPVVTSLAKIYFLHYKPEIDKGITKEQPAGADAPISGASNSGGGESSKINMAQLRKETWSQTAFRVAREAMIAKRNK